MLASTDTGLQRHAALFSTKAYPCIEGKEVDQLLNEEGISESVDILGCYCIIY